MNETKLILLTSPVLIASMLLGNPAEAIVKSASARPHVALASAQPNPESVTSNSSQESNSITEQLGCNCAYCTKARGELQGKLPIPNNL